MRNTAIFTFYGSLQDFFPAEENPERIVYAFRGEPAVKDSIEALGPPHPEVAGITINNHPASFSSKLKHGDRIAVYSFDDFDGCGASREPDQPPGKPQFILDVHLGGLARYLRLSGIDAAYDSEDKGDRMIAAAAVREERILLTRDIGLLKRAAIVYGYWLRNTNPRKQFVEVAKRYRLEKHFQPFWRCTLCNGLTREVDKSEIRHIVPARVYSEYSEFRQCVRCKQVYWKGSHYDRLKTLMEQLHKKIQFPE
jgi:uncharacterized protein with PIN domain